jgi:zinc protease
MNRGPGPFTASSAVVTEKTDSALIEFFSELNRIRDEAVLQDELERAKRYVALGLPQNFETTSGVASQIAGLVRYGIDPAILGSYVERIMAVSAEDVSRVAREYVRPGRAVVVVVGDRSTIEAGLRDTGIAPVEIRDLGEFVR